MVFLFLVLFCPSVSYSQKLTACIYSGMNFSDNHGQLLEGNMNLNPDLFRGFYLDIHAGYQLESKRG